MNQITHWLDGSNIYGSDERKSRDLRLGSRGLLKFQGSILRISIPAENFWDEFSFSKFGQPKTTEIYINVSIVDNILVLFGILKLLKDAIKA
jgi:hypothetical protein